MLASKFQPPASEGLHELGHVQAFYLPATKHIWWWLGIRSIDKASFNKLLQEGNSVVLVPGGVSECMIMESGQCFSVCYLACLLACLLHVLQCTG